MKNYSDILPHLPDQHFSAIVIIPDVYFPQLPSTLPPALKALQAIRKDRRRRIFDGLYLLATTGLSVCQELRAVMETVYGISPGNLSIQKIFHTDLPALGLAIKETPYFIRNSRLALLRLSTLGKRACLEMDWPLIESEWERLICSHEGLLYPRHSLGLLAFCWQARLRNWSTELLPSVNASLEPDLLLSKGGVKVYAEFEIRVHDKIWKWMKIRNFQGFVAICSFFQEPRHGLVEECKQNNIPGIATDLEFLTQSTFSTEFHPVWVETWGNASASYPQISDRAH